MRAKPECSLVCEPSSDTHVLDFIHHFLWRKRPGRARSSEDVQAATPPDEDDILDDEEVQELTRDNDSLPDNIISLNANIVHMAKSFSTQSETLATFTTGPSSC